MTMFACAPLPRWTMSVANDPNSEHDEAHGLELHYDLHVWVFGENPNGPLATFNPVVTCEHHIASGHPQY
jgi:hypothetical protein